jgi:pimeloyl-ACP methyl ester carboxylesterase
VPAGRTVEVDGQILFVRDTGAPTAVGEDEASIPVVLLHGLLSTADLTWFSVFDELARTHRVVAPDLAAHGSSPVELPFRLTRVVEAIARLIEDEIGGPVLIVGFSMGGVVAQLLWRRHPKLVAGLVLCSTASDFRPADPLARLAVEPVKRVVLGAICRSPRRVRASIESTIQKITMARSTRGGDPSELQRWARAQVAMGDPIGVATASSDLHRFDSRAWIGAIDVPCAGVLTTRDSVVAIDRQRALLRAVRPVQVTELDGDHGMFVEDAEPWSRAVLGAVAAVEQWVDAGRSPREGS